MTLSYLLYAKGDSAFLKEAVERLLRNLQPDEEILILDDGHTSIAKGLRAKSYPQDKLRIVPSDDRLELVHPWLYPLMEAQGEIIKPLTNFDLLHFPSVQMCKQYLLRHPEVQAVAGNCLVASLTNLERASVDWSYEDHYIAWCGTSRPFFLPLASLFVRRQALLGLLQDPGAVQITERSVSLRLTQLCNMDWFTGVVGARVNQDENLPSVKGGNEEQRGAVNTLAGGPETAAGGPSVAAACAALERQLNVFNRELPGTFWSKSGGRRASRKVGMLPDPFQDSGPNQHLRLVASTVRRAGWEVIGLQANDFSSPQRLRHLGLDIIHVHFPQAYEGLWRVRYWRLFPQFVFYLSKVLRIKRLGRVLRSCGIPVIWQVHDLYSHLHRGSTKAVRRLDEQLHQTVYEASDGLILHEASCAGFVFKELGKSKPFAVAPLGDYSIFHGCPVSRSQARTRLDLPEGRKVFAFLGQVRPNRTPASVARALVRSPNPEWLLLAAGSGVSKCVPRDPRILCWDALPQELFLNIMCAADYLVYDAENYMTSAILRTSMSYGVPVIARRYGAAVDMVAGACIWIDDGPDGLECALQKAFSMSREDYAAMVLQAQQRNNARQWHLDGPACIELYERLLGMRLGK